MGWREIPSLSGIRYSPSHAKACCKRKLRVGGLELADQFFFLFFRVFFKLEKLVRKSKTEGGEECIYKKTFQSIMYHRDNWLVAAKRS